MLKEVLSKLMSLPKPVGLISQELFFLRQLVVSLSLQMTGLDLRPFPVKILMGKVALRRIFLHITSPMLLTRLYPNTTLMRRTSGVRLGIFK